MREQTRLEMEAGARKLAELANPVMAVEPVPVVVVEPAPTVVGAVVVEPAPVVAVEQPSLPSTPPGDGLVKLAEVPVEPVVTPVEPVVDATTPEATPEGKKRVVRTKTEVEPITADNAPKVTP